MRAFATPRASLFLYCGLAAIAALVTGCSLAPSSHQKVSSSSVQVAHSEAGEKNAPREMLLSAALLDLEPNACSGVLVSRRRILTAAHCFSGVDISKPAKLVAHFGTNMRASTGQRVAASAPRIHPLLDLATFDLAEDAPADAVPAEILAPENPLDYHDEVAFGGFGRSADSAADNGTVFRWGRLSFEKFHAEIAYSGGQVFRSLLGFLPSDGKSAACSGDSGGPVFAQPELGVWKLLGVVSGGENPCDAPGSPTFTADARPNRDWILSNDLAAR